MSLQSKSDIPYYSQIILHFQMACFLNPKIIGWHSWVHWEFLDFICHLTLSGYNAKRGFKWWPSPLSYQKVKAILSRLN